MKTIGEVATEFPPAHVALIESLMSQGLEYKGEGSGEDGFFVMLTSGDDEVVIHVAGKVELFTETRDPYDPYDAGYHTWNLWSEDEPSEGVMMAGWITRVTGDD